MSNDTTRCTCPSGDGSLRWPCPVHPPEAQAQSGGEVITDADIAEWESERGKGMTSAVGEYTPAEFWLLLDEVKRLRTAPSAPVGVDRLVRAVAAAKRERDETRDLSATTMGEMWLALDAFAQQPAPSAPVGVGELAALVDSLREVIRAPGIDHVSQSSLEDVIDRLRALAPQPAAVGGARRVMHELCDCPNGRAEHARWCAALAVQTGDSDNDR